MYLRILTVLIALALGGRAHAHEGQTHLRGKVVAVSPDHLELETPEGQSIRVELDASTQIRRGGAEVGRPALQRGMRAVVHARSEGGALRAATVQLARP